jgi:hypothetical protein
MKKILLGTSAIALAGAIASPAASAEWSMDVGGFFTGGIGIVNDEINDDQQVLLIADSEIHFDPSITIDNGLKFGAHVEFEANNASHSHEYEDTHGGEHGHVYHEEQTSSTKEGNVDEYDMFVSGSFGEIRIGANDGAQDKFSGGLPCPTFTCTDDGILDRTGASSFGVDGGNSSDAIKISYFSPSFSGFQAGVSYIPDNSSEGSRISGNNDDDSFEVGAAYAGSFGDVSVNLGVGYYHNGAADGDEDDNLGVTGGVGFGGFSIGAGYESSKDGEDKNWGAAASYATGPWKIGVHYGEKDYKDSDDWNAGVGVSYAIAAGVTAGATAEFGESGEDDVSGGALFLALSF